ncbi:MAG TPA: peptidylprolyl isomerase [Candidatus Wallbacteria bacterium]|nr:peptidylprolyl isomerase [Candidatus Wallbacteria bacterium]
MNQGSIFFSKNNIIVKVVIWSVVAAFVLSIFIFAGTFHLNQQQQQAVEDLKNLNKKKVSDSDYKKVLASVKFSTDEVIDVTAGDFYDILHRQDEQFRKFYSTKKQREELLNQIVEVKIMENKSKRIIPTPADYDEEINKIFPSKQQMEEYMKNSGMTREILEERLRPQVQEKLLKRQLAKPREIAEELLNKYYEENKKEFVEKQTLPGESKETEVQKSFADVKEIIRAKLLKEVSDADIQKYYEEHKGRYKNPLTMDLAHLFIKSDSEAIKKSINPTDEELKKYHSENKDKYKTPRTFEVKAIVKPYDNKELRDAVTVSETEAVEFYGKNNAKFTTRAHLDLKSILVDPKSKARVEALKPTDEELLAFYNQTDEVKASHILVKDETHAIELKKKIDGGANFEELAKSDSTCPSKDKGGDLGFFKRDMMVKPFSDAAFALKIGEITGPVKSDFGYHIIKSTDQKTAYAKPFAEVKEEVKKTYIEKKLDEQAKTIAEDVVKKIKAGESFAELAAKYSDGASKSNGGVLGTIYQDNKEPIENIEKLTGEVAMNGRVLDNILYTAFALNSDTTPSEVIKTPLGFHVVMASNKVDSRLKPYEECKAEVIEEFKKEAAKAKVEEIMNEAYSKLTKGGFKFEEIQAKYSDGPSAKSGEVCGKIYLGEVPKNYDKSKFAGEIIKKAEDEIPAEVTSALAKLTFEGQCSEVIKLPWAAVILKAEKIYEPSFKTFEDAKDALKTAYVSQKTEELIKKTLTDARDKAVKGEDFGALAKSVSEGATKDKAGEIGLIVKGEGFKDKAAADKYKGEVSMPWGTMIDPAIEEAVFELEKGAYSDVIKSSFGFHVFKVKDRIADSYKDLSEVKDKIKETLSRSALVTDEEIKTYYEQHKSEYTTQERAKVRIIVVPTEAEAEKIHTELTKNKKDFAELATQFSKDVATKTKGGDMGFITRGQVNQALENAAFSLGIGAVSSVFKTPAGYNIIQVTEKEAAKTASIEEKREEIKQILSSPKENEIYKEYMSELRNSLDVGYKKENFELLTKYE